MNETTEPKYCVNCDHYPKSAFGWAHWTEGAEPICQRTVKAEDHDPSDLVHGGMGRYKFRTCLGCRHDETDCGHSGVHFVEKKNASWFVDNIPQHKMKA